MDMAIAMSPIFLAFSEGEMNGYLDGMRSLLGLFNPQLQESLGTLRTLLANEFFCTPEEIDRLESTFNLKMESLESFLQRYLAT